MTDVRKGMIDLQQDTAKNLLRHRRSANPNLRLADIYQLMSWTYTTNLADSRGTQMESYWRLMVDVCDELLASEMRVIV